MAWTIHCDACGKHIEEEETRAYISFEIKGYADAEICIDCADRADQLLHILHVLVERGKEMAKLAEECEDEG